MATFTSWTDLLNAAKNALVARDLSVSEYTTPDGRTVRIRSLRDLQEMIGWLESKAAAETAPAGTATRRTTAVPSSGGNW